MENGATWRALHMADVHLEMAFAYHRLPRARGIELRSSLRRTFRGLLALAEDRGVDAITIAGDLFDGAYARPELAEFLGDVFRRVAPMRVFITPGERDPYGPHSLYSSTRWSDNVTVFLPGAPRQVTVAPGVALVGMAIPAGRDREAWKTLPLDAVRTNILLAHALDAERESAMRSTISPLTAASVRAAGYDLALLGHEHSGRTWPESDPICVYPGSPQPLTVAEEASLHSAVLVTVENGNVSLEPIPVGTWRYPSLMVDLTGCTSPREIARRVEAELQRHHEAEEDAVFPTVRLEGAPACEVRLAILEELLDRRSYVRFEPHLVRRYGLESLARERTVRGMLAAQTLARALNTSDDAERAHEIRVAALALGALGGKTGGFDAL